MNPLIPTSYGLNNSTTRMAMTLNNPQRLMLLNKKTQPNLIGYLMPKFY